MSETASVYEKKQITGIEPASPAWEAGILPMNYICILYIIMLLRMKIKGNLTYRRKILEKNMNDILEGEIVITNQEENGGAVNKTA